MEQTGGKKEVSYNMNSKHNLKANRTQDKLDISISRFLLQITYLKGSCCMTREQQDPSACLGYCGTSSYPSMV